MTVPRFAALFVFSVLPGCSWHDRIDANEDAPLECVAHGWRQAVVVVEALLPEDIDAGGTCVPLEVGDRFLVTAPPGCAAGLLTGEPTPEFIATVAPYCGLEEGPAFICRAEVTDGGPYDGPVIAVEMRGETLLVDWDQPAWDGGARVNCTQSFRVSLTDAVAR